MNLPSWGGWMSAGQPCLAAALTCSCCTPILTSMLMRRQKKEKQDYEIRLDVLSSICLKALRLPSAGTGNVWALIRFSPPQAMGSVTIACRAFGMAAPGSVASAVNAVQLLPTAACVWPQCKTRLDTKAQSSRKRDFRREQITASKWKMEGGICWALCSDVASEKARKLNLRLSDLEPLHIFLIWFADQDQDLVIFEDHIFVLQPFQFVRRYCSALIAFIIAIHTGPDNRAGGSGPAMQRGQ